MKKLSSSSSFSIVSSISFIASISGLVLANGCSPSLREKSLETPLVLDQKQTVVAVNKPSVAPADVPVETSLLETAPVITNTAKAISVSLTLDRTMLLETEFMYNLDLQYSSQFDEGAQLYNQSMVVTNIPARFRISGKELQLISDQKLNFPSDVNHPEKLIARFEIITETENTITVKGMNSATFLAQQFGSVDKDSKKIGYSEHWIRSFEFDPKGNFILQETSLQLDDGKTIGEFMESVYPRAHLNKGMDFEVFEMDAEDVSGNEGVADRFRLIKGDKIFRGEKKLAFAQHFDISRKDDGSETTIDWYVTGNIPDKYLDAVKQGVEGWNRYFVKMQGIERPVLRFMGKLPEGVKLGDPRYNVINWDSRLVAGAAFESQTGDPETGKQSHSLIYLPAAWVKIGSDYWKKGQSSEIIAPEAETSSNMMRFTARARCSRDLRQGAQLLASGRIPQEEIEKFGIQLLKQTLFHEVGHALGMDHNFKGSLSWDRSAPGSMFSTSIMDYNDYELERRAFDDVNSDAGPLLEYDRQFLSAVYNGKQDIANSDPVLPVCNDEEADNEAGGVDPLCVRYDVEKDPTQSIVSALRRVESEKLEGDVSLSEAISRIPGLVLTDQKISNAKSKEDVALLADLVASTLKGSLNFYLVSGEMSLGRTVRTHVKTLLEHGDDLPEGYDVREMRERVFSGILKVTALRELPTPVQAALTGALSTAMERLAATPYLQGLKGDERSKAGESLVKSMKAKVDSFVKDTAEGLPSARSKLLAMLVRRKEADFYLGKVSDSLVDYEKGVVNTLSSAVMATDRTGAERVAAAKALITYKGRLHGNDALASVKQSLLQERVLASTNAQRRTIETVLTALGLN